MRDTPHRLAERDLYDAYWSDRILDERTRNLITNQVMPAESAYRITDLMRATVDAATVDEGPINQIEPAMTNRPKTDTSSPRPASPTPKSSSPAT